MRMNKEIAIIGTLPSTAGIGGVTIHTQRLLDFLNLNKFNFKFIDYKKTNLLQLIYNVIIHKIVHLHITNPYAILLLIIVGKLFLTKTILTLHGNIGRYDKLKNNILKIALKLTDIPIIINKTSYNLCKVINKRCLYIPAFIPPINNQPLDTKTSNFLTELRNSNKTLCSTNAYNTAYDKSGNDLYGIDFLIREFCSLPDYILIVSDPSGNYRKKHQQDIPTNVFFISYPHNYFELLKQIDIFIRYTTTDGDALSVKEALYLNKKTICTNIVDRPDMVYLCELYDHNSFIEALTATKEQKEANHIKNSAIDILKLYNSLI